MGNTASSSASAKLSGAADKLKGLGPNAVRRMRDRFFNLECEALNPSGLAQLMDTPEKDVAGLFQRLDSDRNKLVDGYEVIGSALLLSEMPVADKADALFHLYDLNGSGQLTLDEMTIMLRTLASALGKLDAAARKQGTDPDWSALDRLCMEAFDAADADKDGEVTRSEYDAWLRGEMVASWLRYWLGAEAAAAVSSGGGGGGRSSSRGGVEESKGAGKVKDSRRKSVAHDDQVDLAEGELWEDPDFPPSADSLYRDGMRPPAAAPPAKSILWLRPSEFCPGEPALFKAGIGSGDVIQGALGDCWFLSALSVMASKPHLLERLFVETGQEAQGRYCVQFYKDGDWKRVFIDDRIPCDAMRKPLYAKCKDPDETWVLMVEKAYAKLHGCYECLVGGYADYGLQDMTGGAPGKLDLASKALRAAAADGTLWEQLMVYDAEGLMGAARSVKAGEAVETSAGQGVLAGHAYSVLDLVEVDGHRLVKVRNPWGMMEWTGDWADGDVMWDDYPAVAKAVNYSPGNDGTFFMSFADFADKFNTLYTLRLFDDHDWDVFRRNGEWTDATAGGCPNTSSWVRNPQIRVTLPKDGNVVLALSQRDNRFVAPRKPKWNTYDNAIGFIMARGDGSDKRLTALSRKALVAMSPSFKPVRTSSLSAPLPAGSYVFIPCTFKKGELGKFTVSVYSNVPATTVVGGEEVEWDEEIDEDMVECGDLGLLESAPPDPPSVADDHEGTALKALQKMVGQLQAEAASLLKRKAALMDKLARLE